MDKNRKEGEPHKSAFYACNDALGDFREHVTPIFEKYAGKAAIKEAT